MSKNQLRIISLMLMTCLILAMIPVALCATAPLGASKTIALQTNDGKHYLVAVNGGGSEVNAELTTPQKFEVLGSFTYNQPVSFKTTNERNFLSAENGGGSVINAKATKDGDNETFRMVGPNGGGSGTIKNGAKVAIMAPDNRHFVCAENGGGSMVTVDRTKSQDWETFTVKYM